MNKIIKQAFTLIELLVVIAIIGILSGLIVVSMGGMTTKASIAKSQVFSNSLRNSLMMNLISEWKFDGPTPASTIATNNDVLDTWSSNNGAITTGNEPTVMEGVNCVYNKCLSFNGTSSFVDYGNKSIWDFGLNNFTVAVWVKTILNNQSSAIVAKTNSIGGNNGWYLALAGNNQYNIRIGNGTSRPLATYAVPDTNWHYVVGVRSGDNVVIYLDGIKGIVGTGASTIDINSSAYSLSSGRPLGYSYFAGSLDDIRIYNAAIPASQIKAQYFAGANNLLFNGSISREEYISRINAMAYEH